MGWPIKFHIDSLPYRCNTLSAKFPTHGSVHLNSGQWKTSRANVSGSESFDPSSWIHGCLNCRFFRTVSKKCLNIYTYVYTYIKYGYTLFFGKSLILWIFGTKVRLRNKTLPYMSLLPQKSTSTSSNYGFFGRCSLTEFLIIQQNKNKNNPTFGSFGGKSIGLTGGSVSPLCTSPFFFSSPNGSR